MSKMIYGWLKPLLLLAIALLVPFLPFLLFGEAMEQRIEGWVASAPSPPLLALGVIAALATDIFLPIPSSAVSTAGGAVLGIWLGTLASWLGMTLGAMIGFAAARLAGRPLALRLSGPSELAQMEQLSKRTGPAVLVLTRAVPLLAEAGVLLMGATGLTWRRFLPPVAAANLGIAFTYSALGDLAVRYEIVPLILALSLALPVVIALLVNRRLKGRMSISGK